MKKGDAMKTRYIILSHLVCELYDESTDLQDEIWASNDEEAIEAARKKASRKGYMKEKNITRISVMKGGETITRIK